MNLNEFLMDNIKFIEEKKAQTTFKIKYITNYVEKWLYVFSSKDNVKYINFIDCMCNAGIYQDGDFGTAIEVLKLFIEFAKKYREKTFNLYLNDIDKNRIRIIQTLCNESGYSNIANINVKYSNLDVNDYVSEITDNSELNLFGATILYVDPYNFGTVKVPVLKNFISKHYCEVLYNVFTSDVTRNGFNQKILKCIDITNRDIKTEEDLLSYTIEELKVNKMKYYFYYTFKNQNNTELYRILYITPSKIGLEKLKDTLWEVFKGKEFHRNERPKKETNQMSMFEIIDEFKDYDKNYLINIYSLEAQRKLLEKFNKKTVPYGDIELLILTNTMLKSSHTINYVIKPLIKAGKLKKLEKVSNKNNYKSDFYVII